ncbi:fimbria/pilus outer membrane usher protein [Cysteiniphilum sp. 6C5]|uniref:fimbria/pilus outer membrane usher protein n=1 Tax=unclassified Cysteiniphilum TaxID=2610889 RepID=UPI003F850CC9
MKCITKSISVKRRFSQDIKRRFPFDDEIFSARQFDFYQRLKEVLLLATEDRLGVKKCALCLCLLLCSGSLDATTAPVSAADFDTSLLPNYTNADQTELLGKLMPGMYNLDIYVNSLLVTVNASIHVAIDSNQQTLICLTAVDVDSLPVVSKVKQAIKKHNNCLHPNLIPFLHYHADLANNKFIINVPQSDFAPQEDSGYAPKSKWLQGQEGVGANYGLNASTSQSRGFQSSDMSINIDGHANLFGWQFFLSGNSDFSYFSDDEGDRYSQTSNTLSYSYIQRVIPTMPAIVRIGYLSPISTSFSNPLSYGVELYNNLDILSPRYREYTPVISGTATTTTTIQAFQNNQKIFETTVQPGPYYIDNYHPIYGRGDITVVVKSNNSSKRYLLPYQNIHDALHEDTFLYRLFLGKVVDSTAISPFYSSVGLAYGVNNYFSFYDDFLFNRNYLATSMTSALNFGHLGGVSTSITLEKFLPQASYLSATHGYQLTVQYAKTFDATHTNFTVIGYMFQSKAYKTFSDALQVQSANNVFYDHSKNTISLNVSQGLPDNMNLSTSLIYSDSWLHTKQYSFTSSVGGSLFSHLSWNLSYSGSKIDHSKISNSLSLGLSLMLNDTISLSENANLDSANQAAFNSAANITTSDNSDIGISTTYNKQLHSNSPAASSLNAYASINFSKLNASLSVSADRWDNYNENLSLFGAALFTPKTGVVLSNQYDPEGTYAIIDTDGVSGALINDQAFTNGEGYAILPIAPYQYDTISLKNGKNQMGEIENYNQQVFPVEGAFVNVDFKGKSGKPIYLQTADMKGITSIIDEKNHLNAFKINDHLYYLAAVHLGDMIKINEQKAYQDIKVSANDVNKQLISLT